MEMSKEKKSKTAGKAPLIVVSILLVLTLVVNVVCIQMFSAINTFMAANLNSRLPGAHGSATAEQLTPEQAKEAALAMAQELAAEGIVLLENKDRACRWRAGPRSTSLATPLSPPCMAARAAGPAMSPPTWTWSRASPTPGWRSTRSWWISTRTPA